MELKIRGGYKKSYTSTKKINYILQQNLQSWFASVAKISGTTEQIFTGPVEVMKDSTIKIDNANVEDLNGKSWKEFEEAVMLNGVDQEVEGRLISCIYFSDKECVMRLIKKYVFHFGFRAIQTRYLEG